MVKVKTKLLYQRLVFNKYSVSGNIIVVFNTRNWDVKKMLRFDRLIDSYTNDVLLRSFILWGTFVLSFHFLYWRVILLLLLIKRLWIDNFNGNLIFY